MAYICKDEYVRPQRRAHHLKQLDEKIVVQVTDIQRRQHEQERLAALPFTFEERVMKRNKPEAIHSLMTFQDKSASILRPYWLGSGVKQLTVCLSDARFARI